MWGRIGNLASAIAGSVSLLVNLYTTFRDWQYHSVKFNFLCIEVPILFSDIAGLSTEASFK